MNDRLKPLDAAHLFIDQFHPRCRAAILAGSVVRGEATETSDLDIVIFDDTITSSYRESLIAFEWPIEVFVHNLSTYRFFCEKDCREAKPSMPNMISEGIILKDSGILKRIKQEAKDLLSQGPEKWTPETMNLKRYFITDVLDDLIGCQRHSERIFIVQTLTGLITEFILRTNRKWVGTSKWTHRALTQHDPVLAEELVNSLDCLYRTNDINQLVHFVDYALAPFGGRLFNGFSIGK